MSRFPSCPPPKPDVDLACKCMDLRKENIIPCFNPVERVLRQKVEPGCSGPTTGRAGYCCIPQFQVPYCEICPEPNKFQRCIPLCGPCECNQYPRLQEGICPIKGPKKDQYGCCEEESPLMDCRPIARKYKDGCGPGKCKQCCPPLDCNPLFPCCIEVVPCQPACPAKTCSPPKYCCPHPCAPTKIDPRCCPPIQIPVHPCFLPPIPPCCRRPCPDTDC